MKNNDVENEEDIDNSVNSNNINDGKITKDCNSNGMHGNSVQPHQR